MTSFRLFLPAFAVVFLLFGCRVHRGPNVATTATLAVASVNSGGESGDGEAVAAAGVSGVFAETDDETSFVASGAIAMGGNNSGPTSRQHVDVQAGVVAFEGEDHLFGRVGLFGGFEVDPQGGFALLEVPTLFGGYQHHGTSLSDTLHVDIGPRFSFAVAGRMTAQDQDADLVAAPGLGIGFLVMDMGVVIEGTAMAYLEESPLFVVRGSACLAAFVALCLDVRHINADFGASLESNSYIGVRFGLGLATGIES